MKHDTGYCARWDSGPSPDTLIRSCAWVGAVVLLLAAGTATAHDPHQVIEDVEVGVLPDGRMGVFIINDHYRLQVSNDGVVWRHLANGLDNWRPLTDIALAPDLRASGLIVLGSAGNGVYISEDAGASWRRSAGGAKTVTVVAIAARDGARAVLAADTAGGLRRSWDGGRSWSRVVPQDLQITALRAAADGVILAGDASGNVHRSLDLGATWTRLGRIADSGGITTFAALTEENRILVGTSEAGIFAVDMEDLRFEPFNEGLEELSVQSIAVSPGGANDRVIVATTWRRGAHISFDGGRRWQLAAEGLFSDPQADTPAYYSPHYREVSFVEEGPRQGTVFLAGYNGLFSSRDPEQGWSPVQTFHDGRVFSVYAGLGPDQHDTVLFSTYFSGIFVGEGSAMDWRQARVDAPIMKLRALDIAFSSPADGGVHLFGILDGGDHLLRSVDGGESWQAARLAPSWWTELKVKVTRRLHWLGLPAEWTVDTLTREERLRAWPTGLAISPRFEDDRTVFVATRHRGLYWSQDAGETVEHLDSNLDEFWDIAAAPGAEKGIDLFCSLRERGVFRSSDGGRTWMPRNEGLDFLEGWQSLRQTAFGRSEFRRSLYYSLHVAASPGYAGDGTVFVGGGAGLYRSTDRGDHWQRAAATGLGNAPYILVYRLSPRFEQDRTILASVKGRGLFRSRDGGAGFELMAPAILARGQDVHYIAFGGSYPEQPTLYAASLEEVWRSNDDGQTWEIVERPGRFL